MHIVNPKTATKNIRNSGITNKPIVEIKQNNKNYFIQKPAEMIEKGTNEKQLRK